MIAAFCGSFDPITLGHVNLIERGAKVFEQVVVVLAINSLKQQVYSQKQKLKWIEQSVSHLSNVKVIAYEGLVVDACKQVGAGVLIRGVRNGIDLEYEQNMSFLNHEIDPEIETISFFCEPQYAYVSSSNVRELLKYGQSIQQFVPECVWYDLQKSAVLAFKDHDEVKNTEWEKENHENID